MQPGLELLQSFTVPDRLACDGPSPSMNNEWLAENVVFYFNAIYMTYSRLAEKNKDWEAACRSKARGFPQRVKFNWKSTERGRKKQRTKNAMDYIEKALGWIEETIMNDNIFSTMSHKPFPLTFRLYVNRIFVLYFRIAAIMVANESLTQRDDDEESFILLRSILYFSYFWELLNSTDVDGILPEVTQGMTKAYHHDYQKLITR